MSRVLITGISGFIGSHLAKALVERGVEVFGLITPFERTEVTYMRLLEKCNVICGDLRDKFSLDLAIRESRPQITIHEAALTSVGESFRNPAVYGETNYTGTINLINACQGARDLEKFIYAGTPEALLPREEPYTENEIMRGGCYGHSSPYGIAKAAAEMYCIHTFAAYGFPSIVCRYNNTVHRKTSRHYLMEKVVTGILAGDLRMYGTPEMAKDQIRNWSHINDTVEGTIAVMERGKPGEMYHIASKNVHSVYEVIEIARKTINNEAKVEWQIGTPRPFEPHSLILDPTKAEKELSWRSRYTLEEIILDIAGYWKNKL